MKPQINLHSKGNWFAVASKVANDSDDFLQSQSADCSQVHLFNQTGPLGPYEWALAVRKKNKDNAETRFNRYWSFDYLLLDRNTLPTALFIQRRPEPYLMREAIYQMLENTLALISNWSSEWLGSEFEYCDSCFALQAAEKSYPELKSLAPSRAVMHAADFQCCVSRLKVAFVANEFTYEHRNIVNYLSELLHPIDVIALQITKNLGLGTQTPDKPKVIT